MSENEFIPKAYDKVRVRNISNGFLPSNLGKLSSGFEGVVLGFEYTNWKQHLERIEDEKPKTKNLGGGIKRRQSSADKVES